MLGESECLSPIITGGSHHAMQPDPKDQTIQKSLPLIPAALPANLVEKLIRAFQGELSQDRFYFPKPLPDLPGVCSSFLQIAVPKLLQKVFTR